MKSQESIGIDLINKCLKCLNQNSVGVVVACFISDRVKWWGSKTKIPKYVIPIIELVHL